MLLGGGELQADQDEMSGSRSFTPIQAPGVRPKPRRHPPHGTFSSSLLSSPHTPMSGAKYPRTLPWTQVLSLATCSCGLVARSPVSHSCPFRKRSCNMQLDFPCDSTPPPPKDLPSESRVRRPAPTWFVVVRLPPDGDIRPPSRQPSRPCLSISLLWITRVLSYCLSFLKSGIVVSLLFEQHPHSYIHF